MKAAIFVKSPFSHRALFGFVITGVIFVVLLYRSAFRNILRYRIGLQLCGGPTERTMLARRLKLLLRPPLADRFARTPGNFAVDPEEPYGCLLANLDRSEIERRRVLQRGVFSAVGHYSASLECPGDQICPRRRASRSLPFGH